MILAFAVALFGAAVLGTLLARARHC